MRFQQRHVFRAGLHQEQGVGRFENIRRNIRQKLCRQHRADPEFTLLPVIGFQSTEDKRHPARVVHLVIYLRFQLLIQLIETGQM